MNPDIPEELLARFSGFVAEQMGLHFPRERWHELEQRMRPVAGELGDADALACMQRLLSAPLTKAQIEILAGQLTVGETYFFREPRSFDAIANHILPELIRTRRETGRQLRIWSAGCCTGEEAYSIAMFLDRAVPDLREWQVTILATDINPRFLRQAEEGTFGEWSFRGAPPWLKTNYFQAVGGRRFAIAPRIKKLVTFAYLNLAEDVYPSLIGNTNAMDLIFCRNVLMYFTAERALCTIQHFHRSLVESGWLVVSMAETSCPPVSEFVAVPFDGTTLYKKKIEPSLLLPRTSIPWMETLSSRLDVDTDAARSPCSILEAVKPALATELLETLDSRSTHGVATTEENAAPYNAALALFECGKYAEAAQHLGADSAAVGSSAASSILLARIYANLGELTAARRWSEQAIAADKSDAVSHYLRAVILQEQGIIEEAQASFRRTLYLAPDFVLAHFALGNLAHRQGKHPAAERHFSNTLTLLSGYDDSEVVPHADGLAVGQLRGMIQSIMPIGSNA
jgi:chemotaxis protein methyltransferase CheR